MKVLWIISRFPVAEGKRSKPIVAVGRSQFIWSGREKNDIYTYITLKIFMICIIYILFLYDIYVYKIYIYIYIYIYYIMKVTCKSWKQPPG